MANTEPRNAGGRPRAFDAEDGVAVAMRLFWERGYDGVGVAELARSIGINPPSLYAAYGSKHGLFRRALARYQETAGAFFSALSDDAPFQDILLRLFHAAVDVYSGNPNCKGCLVMDGTRNCTDEEAVALTRDMRQQLRAALADLGRAEGVERPDQVAGYVVFVLSGLSAMARDGAGPDELRGDVDRAMVGLREMLGPPASP